MFFVILGLAALLVLGVMISVIVGRLLLKWHLERKKLATKERERQDRAKREAGIRELLDREQIDVGEEEVLLLSERHGSVADPDLVRRLKHRVQIIMEQREYKKVAPQIKRLRQDAFKADELDDRITRMAQFLETLSKLAPVNRGRFARELRFDEAGLRAMLETMVLDRYETLLGQASGDAEAFKALGELIKKTGPGETRFDGVPRDLRSLGIVLQYPANWNALVASHVKTPHHSEFVGVTFTDQGTGVYRRSAAEALEHDDFTLAKMVLAYIETYSSGYSRDHIRKEVGDVLKAELAKLVARHEARLEAEARARAEASE